MKSLCTFLLLLLCLSSFGQISFFKDVSNNMDFTAFPQAPPAIGFEKKCKIGNIWYFVGKDHRGTELWRTDGTVDGTTIVKDLSLGASNTNIVQMLSVGNTLCTAC